MPTVVESFLKGYPLQPLHPINSLEFSLPPPVAASSQSMEAIADKL